MRIVLSLALLAACDSGGTSDPGVDGGGGGSDAGSNQNTDGGGMNNTDGGSSNRIHSTLTSNCGATLQGRAIVNFNGNLGIAFTEDDSPYTFLGSVQFELPDGFVGAIPNPEVYNPDQRKIVAMTTPSYELHGNHCWMNTSPAGGSVTVTEYHPNDGVVKATFASLPLRSCTGSSICVLTGTIETTGEGVFD